MPLSETRIAAAMTIALCFSGCSGSATEQPPSVHDRFEAYVSGELGAGDVVKLESEIFAEVQTETRACMAALGFDFLISGPEGYISTPTDIGNRAWVEIHGYGISTEEPPTQAAVDPNAEYLRSLSPQALSAYQAALGGGPDHAGCAESSRTTVEARLGVTEINQAASKMRDVLNDPRVVEADSEWSTCAATFGISASSILELTDDLTAEFQSLPQQNVSQEAFRSKEITIATQLFDCTAARNAIVREVNREYLEEQLG